MVIKTEVESRTQGSRPRTQKKSEAKNNLSEDRSSRGQGQECSRPRPKTKDTGASVLKKNFFFQTISKNKVFRKSFASARVMKQGLLCSSLCRWSSSVGPWRWYALDQEVRHRKQYAANWALEQELEFSSKKTEIVLFTDKRNAGLGSLSMNGSKLELCNEARLLGVTLDSKLTWKPHITWITRKATTALMQCRHIVGETWGIKLSMLKWIYTAMIVQTRRMRVCPGLVVSTKSI